MASSKHGRIFLGGSDGNLYEITYAAKDTWRSKRCVKVCHTRSIRGYLPSFLPLTVFGQPQPIVEIKVDDERGILYTRTQNSVVQVFDIGPDGSAGPSRVAETTDFAVDASRAVGGREVFGRGAGDKKGAKVIYMSPIPMSVSRKIQLLTVTADGRRVYWSTTSSRSSASTLRPDRLKAEVARRAVPPPSVGRSIHAGAVGRSLEVVGACASSDTLLLAESLPNESRTSLYVVSRDVTIPPIGTATGARVSLPGLRESVAQLEFVLPGETCAVEEVSGEKGLEREKIFYSLPEVGSSQRFAVAMTAGVAEIELLRPIDTLAQILVEDNQSALDLFFASYGAPESCAMCISLASSASSASKAAASRAETALDNPYLCGQPELQSAASQANGERGLIEEPASHLPGGFDMGAVVPIAEPEWSAAHKGLCLVISRMLRSVWDEPLFAFSRSTPGFVKCSFKTDSLKALFERLSALEGFLIGFINRRKLLRGQHMIEFSSQVPINKRQKQEDAIRAELQRTEQVRSLVTRAADGCYLLVILVERNLSRLASRLETGARNSMRTLRFRDWISNQDGEVTASQLIAALISEHLNADGEFPRDLASALQGCPSYFKETDRRYYDACSLLRKAEGALSVADREAITREAVTLLLKVPLACDLGQVIPQLAMLRAIDYVIQLTVKVSFRGMSMQSLH